MESLKTHIANILILQVLIFLSIHLILAQALTPEGTVERTTKQQVLTSIPPSHETTPTGSSQLFLTSPSGKYAVFLLRRETSIGAGGFGSDFCYVQVQESGVSVWESECTSISNVNTCSLVFSDAGLEIFDGSRSAWDTDVDDDQHVETLVLLDSGDMQMRDKDGELVWKASDNPIVNQNCGSVGAPGLTPAHPPFGSPIHGGNGPFGQPVSNQGIGQQSQLGFPQQQQQQQLSNPPDGENQPLSGLNQPFSSLNQPFGGSSNQQPLVDNTPFDSGCSREKSFEFGVALVSLLLVTLMGYFGFLL